MRPRSWILLLPLAATMACSGRMTPQGNEPFDFNTSAYAAATEKVRLPGEETSAIYDVVLRFYRPNSDRARWLDSVMLPSAPGGSEGTMDSRIASSLIDGLGDSFCLLNEVSDCGGKRAGGTLRVSPIYHSDLEHARVVVEFTSRDQYGPEMNSSQVFLLARNNGDWRILSRGPVRTAGS